MAKRKFGRYTVDFKKGTVKQREDGLWETTGTITGDIEIGVHIDTMSWREDWLAKQTFGKDAGSYKMLNVQNTQHGTSHEINDVIAVWRKEEN